MYPRFNALLAFVLNKKHESKVAISSQYPFGTNKAVQINQAVSFDKGTQTEYSTKKTKATYLIRTTDLLNS